MTLGQDNYVVRKTALCDPRVQYGLHISLVHFVNSGDECISIFNLHAGPVDAAIDITPEQCREFAAHLIAHTDEFEARRDAHEAARIAARFEREAA